MDELVKDCCHDVTRSLPYAIKCKRLNAVIFVILQLLSSSLLPLTKKRLVISLPLHCRVHGHRVRGGGDIVCSYDVGASLGRQNRQRQAGRQAFFHLPAQQFPYQRLAGQTYQDREAGLRQPR